jgi:hypothetical protein
MRHQTGIGQMLKIRQFQKKSKGYTLRPPILKYRHFFLESVESSLKPSFIINKGSLYLRVLIDIFLCFSFLKVHKLWRYFKNPKKLTFHQRKLYRLKNIRYIICTIRCAVQFYIVFVKTLFVYRYFFVVKNWIKVNVKEFWAHHFCTQRHS